MKALWRNERGETVEPPAENYVSIWVVYENPSDYPGKFVVREARLFNGGYFTSPDCSVESTLEEARSKVPRGMFRVPRCPEDDPVIVESWL